MVLGEEMEEGWKATLLSLVDNCGSTDFAPQARGAPQAFKPTDKARGTQCMRQDPGSLVPGGGGSKPGRVTFPRRVAVERGDRSGASMGRAV